MDNLVIVNKDLLRKYRENNGLTQKVMGNILGMSAQFYWQIESGYINPTLKIAQNIIKRIGINEKDFILYNSRNKWRLKQNWLSFVFRCTILLECQTKTIKREGLS